MPAFRVIVMLKPGVLDAAGQAVERGMAALGYGVNRIRIGKVIEVSGEALTASSVDEMCERFLANPLIESWRIDGVPALEPEPGEAEDESVPAPVGAPVSIEGTPFSREGQR